MLMGGLRYRERWGREREREKLTRPQGGKIEIRFKTIAGSWMKLLISGNL